MYYNDDEENVFSKLRKETSTGMFVGEQSHEALTVATSAVEGMSNNS